MIHVIMGLKGSGKTKKLVDSITETVAKASGDVVCIEFGQKLTYDLPHRVRLVDSKEYGINNPDMLKGLLSGLHAGNFDITNVYIDNLYKTIGTDRAAGEAFLGTLAAHVDGGVPVITMDMGELNDEKLGEMFFFFELCCGVSAYLLGVNPFNQPGVEAYKQNMFRLLGKPGCN